MKTICDSCKLRQTCKDVGKAEPDSRCSEYIAQTGKQPEDYKKTEYKNVTLIESKQQSNNDEISYDILADGWFKEKLDRFVDWKDLIDNEPHDLPFYLMTAYSDGLRKSQAEIEEFKIRIKRRAKTFFEMRSRINNLKTEIHLCKIENGQFVVLAENNELRIKELEQQIEKMKYKEEFH